MDTEGGNSVPEDATAFNASFIDNRNIDAARLGEIKRLLPRKNVYLTEIDAGDNKAGSISIISRGKTDKEATTYRMLINRNHAPAVQFSTLAHELGHLFLGHLEQDKILNVPDRWKFDHK